LSESVPPAPDAATRSELPAIGALIAVALMALVGASSLAYFRAEDWLALALGNRALTTGWHDVWTTLWFDSFYRPITDLYQAFMVGRFRMHPWPYFAALIVLFTLQTALLSRIARMRGSDRTVAWLTAAAAWTQVNAYVWSTLWMSNVGGVLAAQFLLLALIGHHLVVERRREGRSAAPGLALGIAAVAVGTLCKEDFIVLAPAIAWLEGCRWWRLSPVERRAALQSWLVLSGCIGVYLAFRFLVMPTPQIPGQHFHLEFGMNWVRNLWFFLSHLLLLPAVLAILARVIYPAAWRREARTGDAWRRAREGMWAGFGWAAIAIQVYLPIRGHGYGYLYGPAFAIAYATAHGLGWAADAQRRTGGRTPSKVVPLAVHWVLVTTFVAVGLVGNGWPRYHALADEAFATLDRALPNPRPGATVLFLDPCEKETLAGRSLFNMLVGGMTASIVRVHYGREDVIGLLIEGPPALEAAKRPPPADLVLLARGGRLSVVARSDSAGRAQRTPTRENP
jgi:hypothetical protein